MYFKLVPNKFKKNYDLQVRNLKKHKIPESH